MRVRPVGLLVYPDVHLLDLSGPLTVFDTASNLLLSHGAAPERPYPHVILGPAAGVLRTSSGVGVAVDSAFTDFDGDLDTLLVAGGQGSRMARNDPTLIGWIRGTATRVRRIGSICTGALLLAKAGLLDGKRATTHWAACRLLAEKHPSIAVDPDAIYVRDENVYTSAGVTAGMDLALALVEEDWGRELALMVARWLVMFVKRPGGQSQFSAHLQAQTAERPRIRSLQDWIVQHLREDLAVPALAARAAMSPRNFARVFLSETGQTPAVFVETARLDAARRMLEDSSRSVEYIAMDCGFGNAERLRRSFQRNLGVSPQDYRRRFRSRPEGPARNFAGHRPAPADL
ncbi:MAG TPA: helix-turn-helix domain-containing protein [Alphaproteobacteria bacterium]|nr:helix-turn-helix domain-containing protein [Alphaproteobacteria bacterium]